MKAYISEETHKNLRWLVGVIPPSYNNPLTLYMNGTLNEGLVMTYPFESMKKHVVDFFGLPYYDFHEYIANGVRCAAIDIPDNKVAIEQLNKAMEFYGYFKSQTGKLGDGILRLHYEPKFQDEFDISEEKILYHVSPIRYMDKILKMGFCPYNKNIFFKFPERVYFFRGSFGEENVKNYADMVCQAKLNGNKSEKYVIYSIDANQLQNKHFFIDPNIDGGIYTNENISPKTIINIHEY